MSSDIYFIKLREKIIKCIDQMLGINARDVQVNYIDTFDFYKKIKSNYELGPEMYSDLENVKERYKFFCEIIPGLYKWKEKTVFIKIEEKYNFGLLLVELLHAKSVTQGHSYIKSWIREGLPHFLAKILSVKCEIHYEEKGYQIYFPLWYKIHKKFDLNILKTILFSENLKISVNILKSIFRYDKNYILELPYKKAKELYDKIIK